MSEAPRAGRASATILVVVLVALLGVEAASSAWTASRSGAMVSIAVSSNSSAAPSIVLTIANGPYPLAFHVGALPSAAPVARDRTLLVYLDPAFPAKYASYSLEYDLATRVRAYLSSMNGSVPIEIVTSQTLATALTEHPGAQLAFLGSGVLPDDVFSRDASELPDWIAAGGTLYWGGGPLGFAEGHLAPNGTFVSTGLGAQGQVRLAGYPLTDLSARPGRAAAPLLGTALSSGGSAWGTTYSGTPTGANVSEVAAHAGTVLGYIAPGVGRESPRASLVFAPVGSGGIYYFGGAAESHYEGYYPSASGLIPQGTVNLSFDVATLAASGFVPAPGGSFADEIFLPAGATRTLELPWTGGAPAMTVVVDSYAAGELAFFWSQSLEPPTASASAEAMS